MDKSNAIILSKDYLSETVRTFNIKGNSRFIPLQDKSISCVFTSPPYWYLRKYDIPDSIWDGDEKCEHDWGEQLKYLGKKPSHGVGSSSMTVLGVTKDIGSQGESEWDSGYFCSKCGAWKGQLGLEPNFDSYIDHLIQIFDEVWRVMRDDGTFFLNIGDTYSTVSGSMAQGGYIGRKGNCKKYEIDKMVKIKQPQTQIQDKSLIGIPFRLVTKMIDKGWRLRNTVIWQKPNGIPNSAKDRFNVDFEYVFFFVKSSNYWFDQPLEKYEKPLSRWGGETLKPTGVSTWDGGTGQNWYRVRNMRPNPEGRIKRCVWSIPTRPYREAHYACVTPDTEILTLNGWKNYKQLVEKEIVATYNLKSKVIEYQNLNYVNEYDFNGEMVHIGKRFLDIMTTPNHRNIIRLSASKKESIRLSSELKASDKIRIKARINYPEIDGIGIYLAELIGWIIAEGHYRKNAKTIEIYQNEGEKAKRIDWLLQKLEIPNTRKVRNRKYNGEIKNQVTWYLKKCSVTKWILENISKKELNKFLVSLPKEEIKALFNGLIGGDGGKRNNPINKMERIAFFQKSKKTMDWFQILCLRLGYNAIIGVRHQGYYACLTRRNFRGFREEAGMNVTNIPYNEKVWCPSTPNGTWVARRNGRVFITGNSFPEALCEEVIKAGCPEFICKKCGQPRVHIIEYDKSNWLEISEGMSLAEKERVWASRETKRIDKGLSDCGCGSGWKPGKVLDIFGGSGTVMKIARRFGRIGVSLDLGYHKLSKERSKSSQLDWDSGG